MRVIGIAGSGAYHIVVIDQQTSEGHVPGVVMFAEGKAVVGFGPTSPGEETLLRTTQLDTCRVDLWRIHWFSIAGRRNIGAVEIGVRSRHVRSSDA